MTTTATVFFTKEKETRNTLKYQEDERPGQPPMIGALYVQKWWAAGADRLRVTLEREGGAA